MEAYSVYLSDSSRGRDMEIDNYIIHQMNLCIRSLDVASQTNESSSNHSFDPGISRGHTLRV